MNKNINKKGLTIVEIIIVIVIVSFISISGTIAFTNASDKLIEKDKIKLEEEIEMATDVYFNMNPYLMETFYNDSTETRCTKVYVLQNEGLLKRLIRNPKTRKLIQGNLCVYSHVDSGTGDIVHKFSLP